MAMVRFKVTFFFVQILLLALRFDSQAQRVGQPYIVITIKTGGDDLRGGQSATADIYFKNRQPWKNIDLNEGQGWGNFSTHTYQDAFDGILPSDFRSLTIKHNGSPTQAFQDYDNWNIDQIKVEVIMPNREPMRTVLLDIRAQPVVRFTGDYRQRSWNFLQVNDPVDPAATNVSSKASSSVGTSSAVNSSLNLSVMNNRSLWPVSKNGQTPPNALQAGYEADGTPLYIARSFYNNSFVIGKVRANAQEAFVPYGGREILQTSFSVYTGTGSWVLVRAGQSVPPNAIVAGQEANGTPLYIARASMGGGLHIGKSRGRDAFIPFDGKEVVVSSFEVLVPAPLKTSDKIRVVRWISPVTGDFESMPEGRHTDQQLMSWGFKSKMYQFSGFRNRPTDSNAIAVYRWTMPNCSASIMFGEHEFTDNQLLSWGYKDKEFQFYAYRRPPNDGLSYVPVYRWINAKPQGDPCRDFTLTVASTELTDEQLRSWGYSDKRLQYYVLR